ncbi:MAG: UDP binding domain-containing protein, partial [Nitrosotalea sp.]
KELKIKVHDPMAMNNFRTIFQNKIIYCNTVDKCLEDSDCCVILTEWDEYKKLNPSNFKNKMKQSNIIDARRILEPHRFSRLNFMAIGLGKS